MTAPDLSLILLGYLAAINAVTLALCLFDRAAATRFWHRVPESWLLMAAFLGGIVTAKLMQILSGHKRLRDQFTLNLNLIGFFHLMLGIAVWSATTPLANQLAVTEVADTVAEAEVAPEPKRFGPGS
jgi:uncharacterized membrane protein YsdA (DUF1294 family)